MIQVSYAKNAVEHMMLVCGKEASLFVVEIREGIASEILYDLTNTQLVFLWASWIALLSNTRGLLSPLRPNSGGKGLGMSCGKSWV